RDPERREYERVPLERPVDPAGLELPAGFAHIPAHSRRADGMNPAEAPWGGGAEVGLALNVPLVGAATQPLGRVAKLERQRVADVEVLDQTHTVDISWLDVMRLPQASLHREASQPK